MSDESRNQSAPLTPLAALLGDAAASAPFGGVLTPERFGAPAGELEALTRAAGVHDLGWLRRIAVLGEDRLRWLNGMVSNSVRDLPEAGGAWNLVFNAQGRVQGELSVWREGEALEMETTADQRDRLLAHFDRYIIMDDVELSPREERTAIGLSGPQAAQILSALGLPAPGGVYTSARGAFAGTEALVRRGYGALVDHYVLWIAPEALGQLWETLQASGAQPVGLAALHALRLAEGIPVYGLDIVDRDIAQETSQMRALHFNKGCYLGQEAVERIRARSIGGVQRHLRQLELTGPLPLSGEKLYTADGAEAGHITSAAHAAFASGGRIFALGLIRSAAELRKEPLTYHSGAGQATLLTAPPTLEIG